MPTKLSALLVQDRVVSFRQMDAAVQRQRLAGASAAVLRAVFGHPGELLGVQETEAGVGRCDEVAATLGRIQAHADVAGGRVHTAPLKE